MVHVHNSIPFSHKKKEIVTLVLLSIFHSHGDLNSLKTVAGAIIGIITFIYCPSRATALHCCISSVLQTFFLTKFIGWHWLMKLYIQVSGIQFCNTSSIYCVFTTPNQVSSHHHFSPYTLFYLPPLLITMLFVYEVFFLLKFFTMFTQPHNTPSLCFYFLSLFCSLGSTHE